MAFQTGAYGLHDNAVNFIEGRRRLMQVMAKKLPHYAYFGEMPQHDGTVSVKADWLLYDAPADGELVGVAEESQVQKLTSAADVTENYFAVRVAQSEIKYESTGGPAQSGSLGVARRDLQVQRAMADIMISMNAGFGSNYASVKKAATNTQVVAGTPVTFFNQRLNVGTGSPAAPTGYDASDQETNKVADNTAANARSALSLRNLVSAASQMAGSLAASYESDNGFAAIVRSEELIAMTAGTLTGIGTLNRVQMGSTNIGTMPDSPAGLKIDMTLACIDTPFGSIVIIPTLQGHNTAADAADHKRIAYVTRPEFTGVIYAGNWEEGEVKDSAIVEKPVVKCIYSYYPPPKRGGVVIQGNS